MSQTSAKTQSTETKQETNATATATAAAATVVGSAASTPVPAAAASSTSTNYLIPLPLPAPSTVSPSRLVPPLSFGLVTPGVYRSACPSLRNFPFLHGLGLKSVIYLSLDPYPKETYRLLQDSHVEVRCFEIGGNKEPFQTSDFIHLEQAFLFALDSRNQPVLVHCNKGKHRTGCFVGILRRLSGLSLSFTFNEYRQFLGDIDNSSNRDLDRLMMECLDVVKLKQKIIQNIPQEFRPDWI